uniref:diacylglycerol kinase n=1 Tax=Pararhizobium sp. IMCC3301 TaxID=3067904 RepID=UPI0027413F69|nr:diacylglycerol kinase [Pararhizobium sp. IMCC3301]
MTISHQPINLPHQPAHQPERVPPRAHGAAHVLAAARYSSGGAKRLLGETAFRHELILFAVIVFGFVLSGAAFASYLIAGGLFLLLVAVEALNTAIEIVVDRISPQWSSSARDAKDLGSFAVFCLLAANMLYALYVIVSPLVAGNTILT